MNEKTTIPAPFLTEVEKEELEMAKNIIIQQREEKYDKSIIDIKYHSTALMTLKNHLPEDLKQNNYSFNDYHPDKLYMACREYINQTNLRENIKTQNNENN
jgi:hypothetical protein|tara:strand:+ start:708 stop:1010 length:303 start_codon:yes stop_codon:yes gene_type:complete